MTEPFYVDPGEDGWDCERLDRIRHREDLDPKQHGVRDLGAQTTRLGLRPARGAGSHIYTDKEWEGVL